MHASSVARDLAALGTALEDPAVDLDALLRSLAQSVRAAVDSSLRLRLTVVTGGDQLVLDAVPDGVTGQTDPDPVRTSLRVPLPVTGVVTACTLTLWAGTPGAFTDLAATLALAWGPPAGVVLDGDLPAGPTRSDAGLDALTDIERAVGVLVGRGRTAEQARAEVARQATAAGTTPAVAARIVLDSVRRPPPADHHDARPPHP